MLDVTGASLLAQGGAMLVLAGTEVHFIKSKPKQYIQWKGLILIRLIS